MQIKKHIAAFLALCAVVVLGTSIAYGSQISVPSAPSGNYFLISTSTGQYIATSTLDARFLGNTSSANWAGAWQGFNATAFAPNTATTTFSSPLIYTVSTNAVTLQNATVGQTGAETQNEFNYVHTATSTFTAPLVYTVSTNAVTCPTCALASNIFNFTPTTFFGQVMSATSTGLRLIGGPISLSASSTAVFDQINVGSTTAGAMSSSTFANLNVNGAINIISTTASSTFANGIILTGGCFLLPQGICDGPGGATGGGSSMGVNWATTAALPSNNYVNGVSGVGATITEIGNGALSVDSNAPAVGDRVLVKNEGTASHNGIYTVTAAGSGIAVFVLTRAGDYDVPVEVSNGMSTYVVGGTVTGNLDTTWAVSFTAPLSFGTSALTYTIAEGAAALNVSFPLLNTNNTLSTAFGTTSNSGLPVNKGLYTSPTGIIIASATSSFYGPGTNGQVLGYTNGILGPVSTTSGSGTPGGVGTELQFRSGASTFGALTPSSFDTNEGDLMIGTSSASGVLNYGLTTLGTSTEPQLVLTDNNPNSPLFTFRALGNTLTIATSSMNATTTNSAIFVIGQNGSACIGPSCTAPSVSGLFIRDQDGTGPSLFMGGNDGGDTDWKFMRTANNNSINDDPMTFGMVPTSLSSPTPFLVFQAGGNVSMSTSTPKLGVLTLGSSSPQLMLTDNVPGNNLFALRTISNSFYLATSTAIATSTSAALAITSGGNFSFYGGPLGVVSGGTATSTATANAVPYFNGTYFAGNPTVLSFTGTTFGIGSSTPWGALSIVSNLNQLFVIATSTGLTPVFAVNAFGGVQTTAAQFATSTATVIDWSATPPQVEIRDTGTAAFSITFINATTTTQWGSRKIVWVCNPHAGSAGALTWGGVEWIGSIPAQTTTADTCDIYSFDVTHATSTSAYKVAGSAGSGFK